MSLCLKLDHINVNFNFSVKIFYNLDTAYKPFSKLNKKDQEVQK